MDCSSGTSHFRIRCYARARSTPGVFAQCRLNPVSETEDRISNPALETSIGVRNVDDDSSEVQGSMRTVKSKPENFIIVVPGLGGRLAAMFDVFCHT